MTSKSDPSNSTESVESRASAKSGRPEARSSDSSPRWIRRLSREFHAELARLQESDEDEPPRS